MRGETAREQLERMELAAQRVHAEHSGPGLLDWRWVILLCDCGLSTNGLCRTCWSLPSHAVEMRLTENSALLYALRHVA